MRQHNTAEERKCWNSARERERLRARFQIRERVSLLASSSSSKANNNFVSPNNDNDELLPQVISYIKSGDRSKFSLSLMDKHFELFSSRLSIDLLQEHWPHSLQLCLAWFDKDYAMMLEEYIKTLASFSLIEYAAWMGKIDIIGSLLLGAVNPCVRSCYKTERGDDEETLMWQKDMVKSGSKALIRFFNCFPLALSVYIVKRVVRMRLEAHTAHFPKHIPCTCCEKTVPSNAQLQFSQCKHSFCEPCFWDHLLSTVDNRESYEDVVKCPCCGIAEEEASTLNTASSRQNEVDFMHLTPLERRQESLQRFQSLSENSRALKSKKSKKKKTIVAVCWADALLPSLGMSRDVRRDKFFSYIDRNAIQYIRGCLVAGVDVEWKNEYGQTALYICAWRGYTEIVKLLLDFGADVNVVANGGCLIGTVCKIHNHIDLLRLFDNVENMKSEADHDGQHFPVQTLRNVMKLANFASEMKLSTLIPTSSNHPGAGSYTLDNVLSSSQVDCLLELCNHLPLDDTQKKKSALCSDRTYYCDSEAHFCSLLETIIRTVALASPSDTVIAFPYMRFLIYNQTGTSLAPHVDLCRVDSVSGRRSTHTFIIYLTSNDDSGETSLLGDVSGEGRYQILARVTPMRGRLLLFPHATPHEGNEVVDVPKIILRGEIMLDIGQ